MANKVGRPKEPFNWNAVDALISLKATERYIAEYLIKMEDPSIEIDGKMIQAKIKMLQRRIEERWGMNFVQFRDQKQEEWRVKLMQMQRKAAEDGNTSMLIWLGKQDLEQKDRETPKDVSQSIKVVISDYSAKDKTPQS